MFKTTFLLFFTFFIATTAIWGQVGIGTIYPEETLHVAGTVRVESTEEVTNDLGLIGADAQGTLGLINFNSSITLNNGTIEVTGQSLYGIGEKDISGITFTSPNYTHDLELFLGPGEINEGKTVIKVFGTPANIRLTGISDGVDGLHLFIYHLSSSNIIFSDETDINSLFSLPENRIKVLAGSETISANGCVELIYDGTAQRWLFLSIHD